MLKPCVNEAVGTCRPSCSTMKVCPVTVIVPAYNEADCIADTVNSLLTQSLAPQEIIVVDDGSTDNTAEIARSLGVTVIYLYRSKVSNDDFIPMTNRLRATLLNRQKAVEGDYVFPGRYGGHKMIQNNRALEAAFKRAGLTDVSSHNMRKTFATRLLSRGAAITDVQHLLGHTSVKTTEKAYAVFVKNERFKQTIDLLDTPAVPMLKIVK